MMLVVFTKFIRDELKRFEMRARNVESLERQGAVLNATDNIVARRAGRARVASCRVHSVAGFIDDFGFGELGFPIDVLAK